MGFGGGGPNIKTITTGAAMPAGSGTPIITKGGGGGIGESPTGNQTPGGHFELNDKSQISEISSTTAALAQLTS